MSAIIEIRRTQRLRHTQDGKHMPHSILLSAILSKRQKKKKMTSKLITIILIKYCLLFLFHYGSVGHFEEENTITSATVPKQDHKFG